MGKTKKYSMRSLLSPDGKSKKHVFKTVSGNVHFESGSFELPSLNRYDACISSMAGCLLGCKFCECTYTRTGYERSLSATEILDQIKFILDDGKNVINKDTIVLVTFMGNGDPFQNLTEVIKAIKLADKKYRGIITRYGVSTIGLNLRSISKLAALCQEKNIIIWLQYSMVSMDEKIRKSILPLSTPLKEAISYLDWYAQETGCPTRYNFPMIRGINDSIAHLDKIIEFINEKPELRMVKLSAYNKISQNKYQPCSDKAMLASAEYLRKNGVKTDLFIGDRNKDLRASCGQLRTPLFNE